jgi:hypothetical protein
VGSSFLFAYGSLVNRASAERALGRPVSPGDLLFAELAGYRLAWSSRQRVQVPALGRSVDAAFLNIEPDPDAFVPGVLMAVSDEELARVATREKGYRRVDVSAGIRTDTGTQAAPVFSFVFPPSSAADDGYMLDAYLDKVRQGWRELGADRLAQFDRVAALPPLPHAAGAYRFVDPSQDKLT